MRLSKRGSVSWSTTFKKAVEPLGKPMEKEEFQRLCTELKITNAADASRLLGPGWRTCQRYWYGEAQTPEPLARLLRAASRHKFSHDDLRMLAARRGTRQNQPRKL